MRSITRQLTVAAMATGAVLAAAVPAQAYVDGDYTGNGVRIRASAPSGTTHGLGYPGQGARLYCYVTSSTVNGNPYWDSNRNRTTGVTGYSAEGLLTPQYANIPHC
ncbi:hypothetical protein [Actinoplanes flavus]|uniref:SH3 domain-containing protein n=1 Tax=Actinoplanes flavus TaxID=2820290 RepID=A0ABS3UZA0_9ACTN|nr:hypothetical protein [Actinoplanes flavus]MBO3743915.1 hypothetical protein [Actinoplanes flavus]